MNKESIYKYSISELLAFKNILESRINQLNFQREHAISFDTDLYDKLQHKLIRINSRINQLVELL